MDLQCSFLVLVDEHPESLGNFGLGRNIAGSNVLQIRVIGIDIGHPCM